MTWVKTDDGAPDHDKVRAAGTVGFAVWTGGVAFCNRNLTDGRIERRRLRDVWRPFDEEVDYDQAAARLVSAGLWHEPGDVCDSRLCPAHPDRAAQLEATQDAYMVHDFFDYQPSKVQVLAERKRVRDSVRKHRERKLDEAMAGNSVTEPVTPPVTNAVTNTVSNGPPVPDPVPVPDLRTYVATEVATAGAFEELTGVALTTDQVTELLPVSRAIVTAAAAAARGQKVKKRVGYMLGAVKRMRAGLPKPGSEHAAALEDEARKAPKRVEARGPPPDEPDEEVWTGEDDTARAQLRARLEG